MIRCHRFSPKCLILSFAAIAVVVSESTAQDRDDLTGSWVLSVDDSRFGMMRPPTSAELDISRADTQLVMTTIQDFGNGISRESTLDIPVDGEEHPVETEQGSGLASAEWIDGELVVWHLTQATMRRGNETSEMEIELTDTYSLRDSGQLQITRSMVVQGGSPMGQTLVYQRDGS